MTRNSIFLFVLPLGLVGCDERFQFQPTFGSIESAIIGGVTDTGDPAVVALYAHAPRSQQGALCTAEVIAPTVLLTAAHCLITDEIGPNAVIDVITGYNVEQSWPANVQVVQKVYDEQFDINNPQNGHDIGLVILNRSLGITPIPFNRTALTRSQIGQPVRLVGYGLSDGVRQTGAGLKRQTQTTLRNFDGMLLALGDGSHNTCSGDSGGPALMNINGVETIIGVTSFGDQTCSQGGYDTRVDRYTSFIDQYLGTCTPQCTGKTCGSDGCGGTCGTCGSNSTCSSSGQCVPVCTPRCDGKSCGSDGCGGSCGTCADGYGCTAAGQCTSNNPCDLNGGNEIEPNESVGHASRLCGDGTAHGTMSSASDADWYTFTVPNERTYVVSLSQLTADYRLDLFKVLGNQLTWLGMAPNNHDFADQYLSRHSSLGGTYYLKVSSARGAFDAHARYQVSVSIP